MSEKIRDKILSRLDRDSEFARGWRDRANYIDEEQALKYAGDSYKEGWRSMKARQEGDYYYSSAGDERKEMAEGLALLTGAAIAIVIFFPVSIIFMLMFFGKNQTVEILKGVGGLAFATGLIILVAAISVTVWILTIWFLPKLVLLLLGV